MGVHDSLEKIRRPRVHIKFDVELGDAVPDNELPFVVGVMGDFSGDPTAELKDLADRNFVNIDRDNFDKVLKRMTPGLKLRVKNTIDDDDTEIPVQLKFESMKDFDPANVAQQVDPLRKLLEKRGKLTELLTKVELSPKLEKMWNEILQDSEAQESLASDLDIKKPEGDDTPGATDEKEGDEA